MTVPRCLGCGDKLPSSRKQFQQVGYPTLTTHGAYGDGLACSLFCAQLIMHRVFAVAAEHGWDLRDLLPDEWRPDAIPWDTWQAAVRIGGRKTWVKDRAK